MTRFIAIVLLATVSNCGGPILEAGLYKTNLHAVKSTDPGYPSGKTFEAVWKVACQEDTCTIEPGEFALDCQIDGRTLGCVMIQTIGEDKGVCTMVNTLTARLQAHPDRESFIGGARGDLKFCSTAGLQHWTVTYEVVGRLEK